MTVTSRIPIERIIKPRSVAVIGASEDESKFGGRIMHNIVRHRYAGTLLPINPMRPTVLGHRAYKSISDAPGPVDLVLVAVPAAQLRQTIEDCAKAGVGACVVVTAQLAEFDAAGAALQDEIVTVAAAHGMRLIGPNCMGLISATHALGLTSTPTLQYADTLRPGPVGFVSQSGALMGALFVFGYDHGVGFSSMITVGNQADLELSDFFEALVDDRETTVICLYVESIKSPRRFVDIASRARTAGKRVLAVKAGQTDAGSAMTQSHTASLAGSYSAFETVCRETGVLITDEPEAMIMAAGVMSKNPRMGPGGIGLVVSSGGGGAVTADRITAAGLPLAAWTDATRARLDSHFLRTHQNNPIDLGAHTGVLVPHIFKAAIDAVFDDANVAAFMYIMTPQPLMPQTADALIDVWQRGTKPVVVVLDTSRFADGIRQQLLNAGLPFVTRIDDALRTLDLLVRERARVAQFTVAPAARPAGAGPLPAALPAGALTETEAKTLCRAYGMPTSRDTAVQTVDEAVAAAEAISFPVVLKGESRQIVHKSDAGLVRLALSDSATVRRAFEDIAGVLSTCGEPTRVVVQEMVRGDAELILGARYDADFGAQVLVGAGGCSSKSSRMCRLPARHSARPTHSGMLQRLQYWPILNGVRGRQHLDIEAVVDALVRLSWLAHDLGPRLQDLEINPLIVRKAGQGAVAVDGRGTLLG